MIDFHISVIEGGSIHFLLWCLFWIVLGLFIAIKERG